jgi:phosphoenolpyruvate---glycerone phosphotransferase subunit DhaL
MSALTTPILREGFSRIAGKLKASADELNLLDAVLGDGDLGVTLAHGGQSVLAELPSLPEDDVGLALARCAQALTMISGSTCGTLLATGLLSAAKATKGRHEVAWSEISGLLANANQAMSQRGKGGLGDKTLLDAVEAARAATEGIVDPDALVVAADEAVAAAVERFREQPSRQGRARIFADRSVGSADPGMVAFQRIVEALR